MICWIKITPSLLVVFTVVSAIMISHVWADFGLNAPVIERNTISSNTNGINSVLKDFDKNARKYSLIAQTDRLREANELVAEITNNVTDLGRALVGNVSKALDDKTTPVDELFSTLNKSYSRINVYLESDIPHNLNATVGRTYASKIIQALDSLKVANMNALYATTQIEIAVGNAIHAVDGKQLTKDFLMKHVTSNMTGSLSTALEQMKVEMSVLGRVIENILRDISQINSYIAKFTSTSQSIQLSFNDSVVSAQKEAENVQTNLLKRLVNYQSNVRADLSNAISKIDGFSMDRKLHTLLDQYNAGYTKIYYYLLHRNESDSEDIANFYQNCTDYMHQLSQRFYTDLDSSIQKINSNFTNAYLERNESKEYCFNKHVNQIFSHLSNFQNDINNCIGREKNRFGRLEEIVDKMVQLINANTQELTTNIISCNAHSGFANSAVTLNQATACLQTNLVYLTEFQTIIGQQLDDIHRLAMSEGSASRFRVENCMTVHYNEGNAAIDGWNDDIHACVASGTSRAAVPNDESIEISDVYIDTVEDYY